MQRDPIIPSSGVLRFLTLAITIVVGFQVGPQLSARRASMPVVGCAHQNVSQDTFKLGERREPRVLSAPFLDRLSPVRCSDLPSVASRADEALALAAVAASGRSEVQRLPIVKHVPRMERGDPPRA